VNKPPHGAPCNGCGLCCQQELCPLGSFVFDRSAGPCPALTPQAEGRFACGLVVSPSTWAPVRTALAGVKTMSEAALYLIGSGVGCDAKLEGEAENVPFRRWLASQRDRQVSKIAAAMRAWGVPLDG
jgi:hypothetical protein